MGIIAKWCEKWNQSHLVGNLFFHYVVIYIVIQLAFVEGSRYLHQSFFFERFFALWWQLFWKTFQVSDFWVQFWLKLVFLNIYCHFFNLINLEKKSLIYTSKKFMSNTKCKINRYEFQIFKWNKIEGNAWAQDLSQ